LNRIEDIAKIISAFLGAAFGFVFGKADGLFYALLAMASLDYVSGTIYAVRTKSLSSKTGFKGISNKIMMFILIGAANLVDIYILNRPSVLRTAALFFYLANEGLSITENCAKLGLPVPEKIRKALESVKDKEENQIQSK